MPGIGISMIRKINHFYCHILLIALKQLFSLQICIHEDRRRGLLELLLPEDLQRADPALLPPLLRRGPLLQRVLGGERPPDRLCGNRRQSFRLQLRKRLLCGGADFKIQPSAVYDAFIPRTLQTTGISGKEGTGNTTQTSISRPADDVLHDMRIKS